jgi:hypothetical protein
MFALLVLMISSLGIRPRAVRTIVDKRKVFSTINQGTALPKWPNQEIKKLAGRNAWGSWEPQNGMVGEAIHSWGDKWLLKMTKHYCVVGKGGSNPLRTITDESRVLSTINRDSTLKGWSSRVIKAGAGKSAWAKWRPTTGMVGEVLQSWSVPDGDIHLLKMMNRY